MHVTDLKIVARGERIFRTNASEICSKHEKRNAQHGSAGTVFTQRPTATATAHVT